VVSLTALGFGIVVRVQNRFCAATLREGCPHLLSAENLVAISSGCRRKWDCRQKEVGDTGRTKALAVWLWLITLTLSSASSDPDQAVCASRADKPGSRPVNTWLNIIPPWPFKIRTISYAIKAPTIESWPVGLQVQMSHCILTLSWDEVNKCATHNTLRFIPTNCLEADVLL